MFNSPSKWGTNVHTSGKMNTQVKYPVWTIAYPVDYLNLEVIHLSGKSFITTFILAYLWIHTLNSSLFLVRYLLEDSTHSSQMCQFYLENVKKVKLDVLPQSLSYTCNNFTGTFIPKHTCISVLLGPGWKVCGFIVWNGI